MARTEFSERVGHRVAGLRGRITQQQLADAMRDRGHRWTQATVWSVEQGDRTLKFDEALALAAVLEITTDELLGESAEDRRLREQWERELAQRTKEVTRHFEAVIRDVENLTSTQNWLREVLAKAEGEFGDELNQSIVSQARRALQLTPADAERTLAEQAEHLEREGFSVLPSGLPPSAYLPDFDPDRDADGEHREAP